MTEMKYKTAQHVLLVSLGGIGDTILSTPIAKGIRRQNPASKITLLVSQPLVRQVFASSPYFDRIDVVATNAPWFQKLTAIIRYTLEIRKRRFDCCCIASGQHPIWAFVLKHMGGIRSIVSGGGPAHPPTTDLSRNVAIARRFSGNIGPTDAFVPETAEDRQTVEIALAETSVNMDSDTLVTCYLSNSGKTGCLNPEDFYRLMQQVRNRRPEVRLLVVGSTDEGAAWRQVDSDGIALNFAGRLSVNACGVLFRHSSLGICNDGGLMHIAGACGCPLIAVMGNTPLNYLPPGDVRLIVGLHESEGGEDSIPIKRRLTVEDIFAELDRRKE
jgi:ADP-heptose:LPS heptosyltransferase